MTRRPSGKTRDEAVDAASNAAVMLLSSTAAFGYEPETHERIAEAAYDRWKLNQDPTVLTDLGLSANACNRCAGSMALLFGGVDAV